jgi:hypothetical protein
MKKRSLKTLILLGIKCILKKKRKYLMEVPFVVQLLAGFCSKHSRCLDSRLEVFMCVKQVPLPLAESQFEFFGESAPCFVLTCFSTFGWLWVPLARLSIRRMGKRPKAMCHH